MARQFKDFHGDRLHDNITVFGNDKPSAMSGTLRLDGQKTRLDLLSKSYVGMKSTIEGWFDLCMYKGHRVNGEDPVLFHKAMLFGSSSHHRELGAWRFEVYPNYVIYGADALGKDYQIETLTFALENLESFFAYDDTETHFVSDMDEASQEALLSTLRTHTNVRLADSERDLSLKEQDFAKPRRVHIVHERTRLPEFKVSGRAYQFDGYGTVNRPTDNHLTITFAAPVSIDEALDAVWAWSWFFNQVAYEQLDLLSLSASSGSPTDHRRADFYIPSEVRDIPKSYSSHLFPGYVPFSTWPDVEKMQVWMSSWLSKSNSRRWFRAKLNATLPGRSAPDCITQIGNLCGAIDSLSDFNLPVEYSKAVRREMTVAATTRAGEMGAPEDAQRVSNLLGLLNRTSLSVKISGVLKAANPRLGDEEIGMLTKHILRLRQVAAHGESSGLNIEPMALPLSQVLSASCVLFDLLSCADGIESFPLSVMLAGRTRDFGYQNFLSLVKGPIFSTGTEADQ